MSGDMAGEPSLIPGYAGHADAAGRRLSDQQVRAWVGELLVDLQDRLALDGVRERVDALLVRCEFADQHVIRAIEDDRFAKPGLAAAIEAYDRKLIEAARRCATTVAEGINELIESIERGFDERAAGIAAHLKG